MINNNKDKNEWLSDFEEFVSSDSTPVPSDVSERVLRNLHKLINPSPWVVFFKILGIHIVTGTLSLSVCHQFGMNPFHTERSLAGWLMAVGGHNVCMIGCGILFVSLGILTSGYFLTIEEVRALRRTEILQIAALGIISLGIFSIFGVEFILIVSLLWLVGGFAGGIAATEAVFRMKQVKI